MSSISKEGNLRTYEQDLGRSPQDRSRIHISPRRVPTNSESDSHLSLSPEAKSPNCSQTLRSSAHPVGKEFPDISIEQETDADVLEVLAPDDLCLGEMQDLRRPTFPMAPGFMDVLSADTIECNANMNFECMFHLPLNSQSEDGACSTAVTRMVEKSAVIEESLGQKSACPPLSNGQFKQRDTPIGLGGARDGIQVIEEFRPKDNRNNGTIEQPNGGTLADQNGSIPCAFHNQSTVSVPGDNNLKISTHSSTSHQPSIASLSTGQDNKMDDIQRSMQSQESTGTRQPNATDRRRKCEHSDNSSGDNFTCDKFPESGTSSCNHHYPEEAQEKGPALTEKCKDLQENRCAHEALIAELNFIKVNGIAEQVEEELMQRHPLSSGWVSPSGLVDISTEDVEELRRVNYSVYKLYQHMTDDQHHQEVALSAMVACLMRGSQEHITSERYDACKLQAASIHKIATRRRALVKLHLDSRGKQRIDVEAEGKKPEVWTSESPRFPRGGSYRGRYIRSGRGFHEHTRASHHDLEGNGNYHDIRGRGHESNPPRGRFEGQSGGRGSRCWVEYAGQRHSPYLINRRSIQR